MILGSNISLSEAIKYGTKEDVVRCLKNIEPSAAVEKQLKWLDTKIELLKEQVFFAQELIENIEQIVTKNTKAKVIKECLSVALSNTLFER